MLDQQRQCIDLDPLDPAVVVQLDLRTLGVQQLELARGVGRRSLGTFIPERALANHILDRPPRPLRLPQPGIGEGRAVESNVHQPHKRKLRPPEVGPDELRGAEVCTPAIRLGEVRFAKVRAVKIRIDQIGACEIGPRRLCPGKLNLAEYGVDQVRTGQIRAVEVGFEELRICQVGVGESDANEIGIAEVGACQVGAVEVGLAKARAAQICFAENPRQIRVSDRSPFVPFLDPAVS